MQKNVVSFVLALACVAGGLGLLYLALTDREGAYFNEMVYGGIGLLMAGLVVPAVPAGRGRSRWK